MPVEERALNIWNNTKEGSKLRVKDVEDLLAWHKVKNVSKMMKEAKYEAWEKIAQKGTVPPKCDPWTDEDERQLLEANRMDLDATNTALGCLQKIRRWILSELLANSHRRNGTQCVRLGM
jgi:hypothetical protein